MRLELTLTLKKAHTHLDKQRQVACFLGGTVSPFALLALLSYVFFEEKTVDRTNGPCVLDSSSSCSLTFLVNYKV